MQSKNNFSKGVVFDIDELRVPPDTAVWIKDMTIGVNINASTAALSGSNEGVRTPTEGNAALTTPSYPSGTNYCIGTYSAEQTNELYYFLHNSASNHSIWVINGDNGIVSKVYQGTLLGFILDPQYFISEGRCTLETRSVIDPVSQKETMYKFLIFAYNANNQFFIEVSSSIATASFSTTYFTDTAAFYNPLELIHLGVPIPLEAIGLNTPVAYTPTLDDLTKQNLVVRSGWQFRVKFVDIFGRESEHGIISNQYITIVGGGCIQASNGLPRCLMLNFDAGNPLVNQIQVEYRKWVGDDRAGALATNWQIYEIIEKYNNSASVQWYSRSYNSLFTTSGSGVTFDIGTNIISYTFCADKNSIPIDPAETSRTEPGLPRISEGVFSINKRIGLANNVRDFQPIPQSEIDKVVFSAQIPGTSTCAASPLRNITFFANVWDPRSDRNSVVRKEVDGKIVFGLTGGNCDSEYSNANSHDQVFADQSNPGFVAYIAGTPYACVAEQGDYDLTTQIFNIVAPDILAPDIAHDFPNMPMQRFTITGVPACKGVLRICSHKSKITDVNFQRTSTYVCGLVQVQDAYSPRRREQYAYNPLKEIEFDCTDGDVNLINATDPMFVIMDMSDLGPSLDGYLIEAKGGNTPIEMNPVQFSARTNFGTDQDTFGSFFTDHNGFYFAGTHATAAIYVNLGFDNCDTHGWAGYLSYARYRAGVQHGDGTGTSAACYAVSGSPFNQVYLYASPSAFPSDSRRVVIQSIKQCSDHSVGIPGVPVVLTKCGTAVTDTSGTVTLIAHNRYNYATVFSANPLPYLANRLPDYSISPNNQDNLVFSQKGGCEWVACGGCVPSMDDVVLDYIDCVRSGGSRITTEPDLYVDVAGINLYGVQSGGKYPVAFWCHDVIGRHTAPQVRMGAQAFVSIPNLNDTGYRQFLLSQIKVDIDSSFAVDPIFTKMTFLVGANVLFTDYFSWGADWVQPIDNTGITNTVNPTAIRVYYGSLNEYNKLNNFSSNTGWEFISTGADNQAPIEGDVVQFIMNGDGTWFDAVISAPISYSKDGAFFTFSYLPELAGLINGALFRVIRPAKNQSGENVPLYEQSLTVDLVNGVPSSLSFVLPYFDSYLIQRLIPVPLLYGQPNAIAPGATPVGAITPAGVTPPLVGTVQYTSSNNDSALQNYATNNINNYNGVVLVQLVDHSTSFPFLFEGPSPADTWGSHISCRGRVGYPNIYEQQQRIGTEVALSDALGDRGTFNGLSYFESKNAQVFDRNTWGDITTVLVETSVMLVICDRDHFIVQFNGSTIRQDGSGNLIAQNQNGIFTSPERKSGTNYGCRPIEINTIRKYAGIVHWLDSSGYLVTHNFSAANSQTDQSGYQGYLLNKIAFLNISNLTPGSNGLTWFHGGIDPKTMAYVMTSFNIPVSGSPSYLNTLTDTDLAVNETLIFDQETCLLRNEASYTYESYSPFPSYFLQKNFVSFKNGKPYIHHNNFANNVPPPPYANYHGIQCLPRITFVTNIEPERVKRYLWMELYCRQNLPLSGNFNASLFLADKITSEKLQTSRLLTPRWVIRDGYSAAEFICALNTPVDPNLPTQTGANVVLDGDPLQGRWLKISIVPQGTYAGTYYELSAANVFVNGVQQPGEK